MKKFLSLLVSSMFVVGCSSAPDISKKETNAAKVVKDNPTNTGVETAGNSEPGKTINDPARKNTKGGTFRNTNQKGDGIHRKNVKASPTRPSPDNSLVSTPTNNQVQFIETRTLKNNPI